MLLTCDSASGDVQSPNEALPTAGAAHLAGFADVIAALMPVRDSAAVELVTGLYQALDADPESASAVVPRALHVTIDRLRHDPITGPDPLAWVPYAHFSAGFHSSLS